MPLLDQNDVEAFFDVGFVVVPDSFSPAEVAEMRAAFERLERTARRLGSTRMHHGSRFVLEGAGGRQARIHRVVWCGAAEPVLSRFGRDRRLLEPAARLLGSATMNQLICQAHFKLPGDGVGFPWHQDSTHRRYGQEAAWRDANGRGSYVQTVIAIDDVNEDNGPLRFIPGSAKLGHLGLPDDGRLPEGLDPSRAVAPTMKAGSMLLFGPYTLHASAPNQSSRPRRTFINGFAYPGANSRVYPGQGAGRLLRLKQAGPDRIYERS